MAPGVEDVRVHGALDLGAGRRIETLGANHARFDGTLDEKRGELEFSAQDVAVQRYLAVLEAKRQIVRGAGKHALLEGEDVNGSTRASQDALLVCARRIHSNVRAIRRGAAGWCRFTPRASG